MPSIFVRSKARALSDSPTVMRWLNHDTMLLASHSSDCYSSCESRRLNQISAFAVLQQPHCDFLGSDNPLMLLMRLLNDASNDRKDIGLFPRRFHSCVPQAAERSAKLPGPPARLSCRAKP
jgi:hypothetical protein